MKAALLSAGAAIVSLSTSMAMLPGAAQANGVKDSAKYSAVYNPVLDGDNRSCEIINTGIQGGGSGTGLLDENIPGLNSLTGSSNTSVMRTLGQQEGSAGSSAGIQFNMIGANIVTLEQSQMYVYNNESKQLVNGGAISLKVPTAKVKISTAQERTIGDELDFEYEIKGDNNIATVNFSNGTADNDKTGSIITGKKLEELDGIATGSVLSKLANSRASGNRAGVVTFRLDDIDRVEPGDTIIMETIISCEPIPVLRERAGAGAFVAPL